MKIDTQSKVILRKKKETLEVDEGDKDFVRGVTDRRKGGKRLEGKGESYIDR